MQTATPPSTELTAQLHSARATLAELGADQDALESGVEAAQAVAALTLDAELAAGTMLHRVRSAGMPRDNPQVDARLGAGAIRVAEALERLGELRLPADWSAGQSLNAQQAETLRNMLRAVAADRDWWCHTWPSSWCACATHAPWRRTSGAGLRSRRARSWRRSPIAWACGA